MSKLKKVLISSFLMLGVSLFAKDYPLMQNQSIFIQNKKRTIIELPFEIKEEPRYGIFKVSDGGENISVDKPNPISLKKNNEKGTQNLPTLDKLPPKQISDADSVFPEITLGANVLEIFPSYAGNFDITLWGHSKYPIVITIKIKDDNKSDTYITFKDYEKEEKLRFENTSHIDAIAELLYPMYEYKSRVRNQKELCLEGHELANPNWAFMTSSGLELSAHFECSGKVYASSRWILTNTQKYPISISEKEDYKSIKDNMKAYFRDINRNIFALSIDSDKEFLEAGRSVDIYVVSNVLDKQKIKDVIKKEESQESAPTIITGSEK